MSDVNYPAAPGFESESPINLPANRSDAEYGSDVIAEMLGRLEFDYAFLTPGSSYRGLHDSLVNHTRNHKPEIILCAHEEIAVAMGQGYAKATGRPALVILHDLVGVQHGLMALYNAWADRKPLVVLGGSGPLDPAERRPIDWIHSANTQCEIVRNCTKWTDEPATLQATVYNAQTVDYGTQLNRTILSLVVFTHDQNIVSALIGANRLVVDEDGLPRACGGELGPRKQPRRQPSIRVGDDRASADRAGTSINRIADEVEHALVRKVSVSAQAYLNGQRSMSP